MSLDLIAMQHELKTQDNAITADPLFVIYERVKVYGMDPEFGDEDQANWIDSDGDYQVADEKKRKALDRYYAWFGTEPRNWNKLYYTTKEVFATACFTRKGCEEYLRKNGHNLRNPYIYVETLYRNKEMIDIRNAIIQGTLV